jgi:hypothetical protein
VELKERNMKQYLVRAYVMQQIETYIIAKDDEDLENQLESVDWEVVREGEIYDVTYEVVPETYCDND